MLNDLSISDLITIVGVILIVKQLREARLVSYMQAMLELRQQDFAINFKKSELNKIVGGVENWVNLSEEEIVRRITSDIDAIDARKAITGHYEMIGILVKSKILDASLADQFYGYTVQEWWNRIGPLVKVKRNISGNEEIGENFEWLALKFEKMNKSNGRS